MSSFLDNTFAVLKSDWDAVTTWFTNPGKTATDVSISAEKSSQQIVNNVAAGVVNMLPWWVWVVGAGLLFLYLLPYFKRRF